MRKSTLIFDRRFVLKGVGTCIGLPMLESLAIGQSAFESGGVSEVPKISGNRSGGSGAPLSANGIPKRLAFLPIGYGVNALNWFPKKYGADYELAPLVKPFEPVKQDITFLQNLKCSRQSNPHGATADLLSQGAGGPNGESVDYLAAELLGKDTRLNYLAMGRTGRADGHGTLPTKGGGGKSAGAHRSLTSVYAALFGEGKSGASLFNRLEREMSALDAVIEDAKSLSKKVSIADRERIDEYFTSIRNIEKRLLKAQSYSNRDFPEAPFSKDKAKGNSPDLMFDMMIVAMLSDSARVFTYTLPGMHHSLSHQQGKGGAITDIKKLAAVQKRDYSLSISVARFMKKLKDTKEIDGSSLLDHSLVAYGTQLKSGHRYGNGPMILAGHGGGGIIQGRSLNCSKYSLSNLWLSMARHVGVETNAFSQAKDGKVIKEMGFA